MDLCVGTLPTQRECMDLGVGTLPTQRECMDLCVSLVPRLPSPGNEKQAKTEG